MFGLPYRCPLIGRFWVVYVFFTAKYATPTDLSVFQSELYYTIHVRFRHLSHLSANECAFGPLRLPTQLQSQRDPSRFLFPNSCSPLALRSTDPTDSPPRAPLAYHSSTAVRMTSTGTCSWSLSLLDAAAPPPSVLDAVAPLPLLRHDSLASMVSYSTASTVAHEEGLADLAPSATVSLAKRLWQPDAEGPTCSMMSCGKQFHRLFRKHHCRMCGRVVCKECSSGRRSVLPAIGSAKALDVRVCDACCHSTNLYPMARTTAPFAPPRSWTMSAPTTSSRPDPAGKGLATSPWGWYAAALPRPCLSAPLAIPNSRAAWHPSPDAAQGDVSKAAPAAVGGEEEDHILQALRSKFASTSCYEGLLLHEPAALDLLLRCAADQLRSREM